MTDGSNVMSRPHASVLGAIGATPLIRLDRFCKVRGLEGTILAKLDYLNPGASKKDRAALGVIETAEREGALRPGQTVVELTSGNMGTGLAIVCAVKGYPFLAVMSRGNSPERAKMMRALGAEVVLVDQAPGARVGEVSGEDLALVEAEAQRLTEARGGFRADQFERRGNAEAHAATTAEEFWMQSGGSITAFCDFVGSGGTLAGVARTLRGRNPGIRCYAVEPEGAAALAGEAVVDPNHPVQGGGYARERLTLLEGTEIDGFLEVGGAEATETARALAKTEGVFAGFSAGANVAAAAQLLDGPERGGVVAVMLCDSGMKYLSTDLWAD